MSSSGVAIAGTLERRASRTRTARRQSMIVIAWRMALVLGIAGLWQTLTTLDVISPFWISSPTLILRRFYEDLASGALIVNIGQTLYEAAIAFVVASVAGILAGLYVARHPLLEQVLGPFVTGLNSMPRVAFAPLIMLWLGIGAAGKIATACTLVFFILLINLLAAAKDIDRDLVVIARLTGASDRQIMWRVVLPSAVPWIFAGLQVGLTYALLGVVVAEILSSNSGIGYIISRSAGTFDTTGVFEGLITLAVIASLLDAMMGRVQSSLLKWRPR